jgi:hypothetical protein
MLIEVVAWSVLTSVHVSKALYVVTAYGQKFCQCGMLANQSIKGSTLEDCMLK